MSTLVAILNRGRKMWSWLTRSFASKVTLAVMLLAGAWVLADTISITGSMPDDGGEQANIFDYQAMGDTDTKDPTVAVVILRNKVKVIDSSGKVDLTGGWSWMGKPKEGFKTGFTYTLTAKNTDTGATASASRTFTVTESP